MAKAKLVGTADLGAKEFSNITLTVSHSREKRKGGGKCVPQKYGFFHQKIFFCVYIYIYTKHIYIYVYIYIENDWFPFFPLRPNLVPALGPGSPSLTAWSLPPLSRSSPREAAGRRGH